MTKVFRKAWDDLISNVQTFGPLLTQIKVLKERKKENDENNREKMDHINHSLDVLTGAF